LCEKVIVDGVRRDKRNERERMDEGKGIPVCIIFKFFLGITDERRREVRTLAL